MSSKGSHTWDIVIEYQRCPSCGWVFEDRQKYKYRLSKYIKEVHCPSCGHEYELTSKRKPKFGPIWDYD